MKRRAALSLAANVVPLLVAFVVAPYLYRQIGAARFGLLSIALLTPQIAASFDFGLSQAGVRRFAAAAAQADQRATRELGATYALALLITGLLLGATLFFSAPALVSSLGFGAELDRAEAMAVVQGCAIWAAVALATSFPSLLLRALQNFGALTIIQTAATAILWIGAIVLTTRHLALDTVIVFGIAVTVVAAIACAAAAWRRQRHWFASRLNFRLLAADARFAFGIFVLQLASMVAYQVDRMLVSGLASPALAGAYALCSNFASKIMFGVGALTGFAFPHAASLSHATDRGELSRLLATLQLAATCIIVPTVLPALLLAEPFLRLWVGSGFAPDMVPLFQLLWIGFSVSAFAAPAVHVWLGSGGSMLGALFACLTAVTSVVLLWLAVPRWGLVGAGWASLGALLTSLPFSWIVRRRMGLATMPREWRTPSGLLLGTGMQALVLATWRPEQWNWAHLVAATAVSLAGYFFVRLALGLLTDLEKSLLHSLARFIRDR